MGSLMSTMKTGVTVTFLLSVLSGFSLIHCSQPLQWIQDTNGKIPRNAVKVSSRNKTPHYRAECQHPPRLEHTAMESSVAGRELASMPTPVSNIYSPPSASRSWLVTSPEWGSSGWEADLVRLRLYRGEPYPATLKLAHSETATLVRGSTLMVSVMRNSELLFLLSEESSWSIPTLLIKFPFVVFIDLLFITRQDVIKINYMKKK